MMPIAGRDRLPDEDPLSAGIMKNSLSYQSYLKSPYRSTKYTTYFEVYDELFARYRGKPITFVEIGVLCGGSLFMWRDFFGPKARIIGVDLNPNAKKWADHGFEIFIGSQSDEHFWKEFITQVGPVDIVLDDGGHTYAQQIITVEMLLENIKDKGTLVIEDTHTSYMVGFGNPRYSLVEYVKKLIDRINYRSERLDRTRSDLRIWSIQSFESIVAFHINRQATHLLSELTENNGADDFAMDFRYFDNSLMGMFNKGRIKFKFLRRIPGAKLLSMKVRDLIGRRTDSTIALKKFFDSASL